MSNYPIEIKKLLSQNDHICFTGSYNVEDETIYYNFRSTTAKCNISKNPNNYNLFTSRWFYYLEKSVPNDAFLAESYIISSFDPSKNVIGTISLVGLYLNSVNNGGLTDNKILSLGVASANGIFKNVTDVIIDFRNSTRNMYFIKSGCKKCC